MLDLNIPKFKSLRLEHLVLDFNGTISFDGIVLPGVVERLMQLQEMLAIHVITADTFGSAHKQIGELCPLTILKTEDHRSEKMAFVTALNPESVAAIGNGRNDVAMLKESALGIAVIQGEGASLEAIQSADLVCTNICDALDLLRYPRRLTATLRG
jgi:soluble P-type ATPase